MKRFGFLVVEFVTAVAGDMQLMPGLPAAPAAHDIDVDVEGRIVGLR